MAVREEIALLRKEIERHNRLYYLEARPEITDQEYDAMLRRLKALEREHPDLADSHSPTQVVEPRSKHARIAHKFPMLSLENTYSPDELIAFDTRVRKTVVNPLYAVEPKIDGVAVALTYRDGRFIQAVTRGDGSIGEDVTTNVGTIDDLPKTIGLEGELHLRGEVYIAREQFARIVAEMTEAGDEPFANPRNTAAGTIKLLDPREVARRKLGIAIHSLAELSGSYLQAIDELERNGFPVVPLREPFRAMSDLIASLDSLHARRRDYPFETDGLVIKLDAADARRELGERSRSPRWAIAYKFEPEIAESRLNSIDLQVGRTGVVTPVAKFDPVLISGTTVSSATLHNEDEIRRLDIRVGDRVKVQKAGEIIPQIIQSLPAQPRGEPFEMPKRCPVCSSALIRAEGQIKYRCVSPACPATIRGRILHFGSRGAMKIDGLGPRVVDALVESHLVRDSADLYELDTEKLLTIPRFAEKSAANLAASITASKQQPLEKLLFALGIPGIGESTARDLSNAFGSLDRLASATPEELIAVPEIGETLANSIVLFFSEDATKSMIHKLRQAGVAPTVAKPGPAIDSIFSGKRVVITGSIDGIDRRSAEDLLRRLGAIPQSDVTKKTDIVIVGESPGSKADKALALGIEILQGEEFLKAVSGQKFS